MRRMEAPRGLVMARARRYEDRAGKTGRGMAIRLIRAADDLKLCVGHDVYEVLAWK